MGGHPGHDDREKSLLIRHSILDYIVLDKKAWLISQYQHQILLKLTGVKAEMAHGVQRILPSCLPIT